MYTRTHTRTRTRTYTRTCRYLCFLLAYCHLCYNLTKSTPGFTADAHDCSRFYMCEPNGAGGWNTFHMTCPVCTFWDQDLLTCVQVWDDPVICRQTAVTDNVTVVTHGMWLSLFKHVSVTNKQLKNMCICIYYYM